MSWAVDEPCGRRRGASAMVLMQSNTLLYRPGSAIICMRVRSSGAMAVRLNALPMAPATALVHGGGPPFLLLPCSCSSLPSPSYFSCSCYLLLLLLFPLIPIAGPQARDQPD